MPCMFLLVILPAGLIEKIDNGRRALRVAGKNAIKIPLVGVVTAGLPITAIENITEYIPFYSEKKFLTSKNLFHIKKNLLL